MTKERGDAVEAAQRAQQARGAWGLLPGCVASSRVLTSLPPLPCLASGERRAQVPRGAAVRGGGRPDAPEQRHEQGHRGADKYNRGRDAYWHTHRPALRPGSRAVGSPGTARQGCRGTGGVGAGAAHGVAGGVRLACACGAAEVALAITSYLCRALPGAPLSGEQVCGTSAGAGRRRGGQGIGAEGSSGAGGAGGGAAGAGGWGGGEREGARLCGGRAARGGSGGCGTQRRGGEVRGAWGGCTGAHHATHAVGDRRSLLVESVGLCSRLGRVTK